MSRLVLGNEVNVILQDIGFSYLYCSSGFKGNSSSISASEGAVAPFVLNLCDGSLRMENGRIWSDRVGIS